MSEAYTQEELRQAAELYPYTWILQHDIKTSQGLLFEFEKRKYLKKIVNDFSPKQVWLKPPQIGASEITFIKALYVAKKKGKDIIYTLPSQSDVQDMVGSKFNRIISQNPILSAWVKDKDTIEQKRVGNNVIYFRGTIGKTQAMMVSSSLNIHDELDASAQDIIVQYQTRQEAQEKEEDKWRWMFSHPSITGMGVDVYWEKSNKQEWFITCPKCKWSQILEWPLNINQDKEIYICAKCGEELPDDIRINGMWKPTSEGDFSGYHVSQLMLHNKNAHSIVEAYNDPLKDRQYFYNFVLGLPYTSPDHKITVNEVLRNCVDETNDQSGNIIIGADTGHGIHYCLMNREGVFYYDHETTITATKDPYDVIRRLLKRFTKSIAVFDQGGDLIGVRKLQAEFPGRVLLCFYRKDRKSIEIIQFGEGEEFGKVIVDRNRLITLIIEQMKEPGRVRLNGTREEWQEFAEHFANVYRERISSVQNRPEKDDPTLYGESYVWKRSGHDHFLHAFIYAYVGLQKYSGELAKITNDNTNTIKGLNTSGDVMLSGGEWHG